MCPTIFAALGTALAGGAGAVGAGGIIASVAIFAGMSTAAFGFGIASTGVSAATTLMQTKAARERAADTNKAMHLRAKAQAEISNRALLAKQDATSDRLMQEGRLHSQKSQERQRAYQEAVAQVTTSAAEGGTTGINLAAIRQSLDMEMGRGNVTMATNLEWQTRQMNRVQKSHEAQAKHQILSATPQYQSLPGYEGAALSIGGSALGNLTKFGGDDWFAAASKTYANP